MRVLDLFSGIGGFSLGLERAGMETVGFCENDKKARLVLKKHWPEVPIYEDVKELNYERLKRLFPIELICGGFPCTPFSQAGKRRGQEDDRYLWPEYFRIIQEVRPRWVIGENVAGIISMGLDQVLLDLESANYSCQTLIIPACAVNAPHRRDRVWIMAYSEQLRPLQREHEGRSRSKEGIFERGGENVSDSDKQGSQGRISEELSECTEQRFVGSGDSQAYRTDHWIVEPGMGRVAHGVPGRVDRLKQLGNSVVSQVVEIIGRMIMEVERDRAS